MLYKNHTIFLLFISSSIAFFLGNTNAVRARCSEPIRHCIMCNTSSDDLRNIKYNKTQSNQSSIGYGTKQYNNDLIVMNVPCGVS